MGKKSVSKPKVKEKGPARSTKANKDQEKAAKDKGKAKSGKKSKKTSKGK